GEPRLGAILLGGLRDGVGQDERLVALPAGIVQLAVEERLLVREPAKRELLGRRRSALHEPQLGGRGVVPRAAREMRLELRVPVLHGEIAELTPRRLQAKLHARVGGVERAEAGEALAELEAAAVPVANLVAVAEVNALALLDRLGAARLGALILLRVFLVTAFRRHGEDAGFLLIVRRGQDFPVIEEACLADKHELPQLLTATGLAARGMPDQPAVRVRRKWMGRVAIDHEEEGLAGEQPLATAGVLAGDGKRGRRALIL